MKQAMGHIWVRDQILLTFDSLAGLPKWRNVKTSPNYSLKQTAMNNEFISEGRRKVIGYNGSGENTETSFQTGEILGSQRKENNAGKNQGKHHEGDSI